MKKISNLASEDIKFRNSIDGIWDIGIGLAFLLAGLAFLFDAVAITAAFYFPIFLLMVGLKQKVVHPRIGYVKHKGMDMKTRKLFTITLIIGTFMLIATFMLYLSRGQGQGSESMRSFAKNYGAIALGLVVAFVLVLIGKSFSIPRFYFYSPIIIVAFVIIQLVSYEYILQVTLLSLGGAILAVGLFTLIKFVRTYPKLEADNE
jgi:MFS family permease